MKEALPESMRAALDPPLRAIATLSEEIAGCDRRVGELELCGDDAVAASAESGSTDLTHLCVDHRRRQQVHRQRIRGGVIG